MAKIKWKVGEAPTGRYRSFHHRSWPSAEYPNDRIAARIECTESYTPYSAKNGGHPPLKLLIADYSVTPWKWRKAKGEFNTLQEAKDAFTKIVEKFPSIVPKD
jgi:hypothetical protein